MNIFLEKIYARLWSNFGRVTKNIYRSGQMGKIKFPITMKFKKIKYVIALNMDMSNKDEIYEKSYCDTHNIDYLHFNWSASKNAFPEQLEQVIETLENNYNNNVRTIVHCAGGRDRTGGAIGHWMLRYNHGDIETFLEQCFIHKIPDNGWLKSAFSELCILKKYSQKL